MIDCTKGIFGLTPYETYRCVVDDDLWATIGRNAHRMWSDFSHTTNGEWGQIAVVLALMPAQFASYILPVTFLYRLFKRGVFREQVTPGDKEQRLKNRWALYLIVAGAITLSVGYQDGFVFYQGAWEISCGIAVFVLGPSWWTVSEVRSASTSPWAEICLVMDALQIFLHA